MTRQWIPLYDRRDGWIVNTPQGRQVFGHAMGDHERASEFCGEFGPQVRQ